MTAKRRWVVLVIALWLAALAGLLMFERDGYQSPGQADESNGARICIAVQAHQFCIPRSYQPKINSPGTHMMLNARAPRFEPTQGRMFEGNLATMVSIYFQSISMFESWRYRSDDLYRIEPLGSVHGLIKERVVRKDGREPHLQYYRTRADGTLEMLIICVSERPAFQCEQFFEWHGMTFFLHQMPEDIPRWRQVQQNLVARVSSWEVRRDAHRSRE